MGPPLIVLLSLHVEEITYGGKTNVKTQGEDSFLQAKKGLLNGWKAAFPTCSSQMCRRQIHEETKCLSWKWRSPWYFARAALENGYWNPHLCLIQEQPL